MFAGQDQIGWVFCMLMVGCGIGQRSLNVGYDFM